MPRPDLTLVVRAERNRERTALCTEQGYHTYGEILDASAVAAIRLLGKKKDLREERIAFLIPPGFEYVAAQWGTWRAGGVAVPLATSHPAPELEYTIADSEASIVVAHPNFADRVRPMAESRGAAFLTTTDLLEGPSPGAGLPYVEEERRAMILYTSGTTSRPKGVVTTHANIRSQVETLVEAWSWTREDHALLVLPLHHVHGIINVLTCALWSGARCTVHGAFEAEAAWREITRGGLTLFMAVPTVYSRLIAAWQAAEPSRREAMSRGARDLRLMVSGSAALPVNVLDRWREISGHTLLERYGMTEIGMALSNPLEGQRRAGHVGMPLPGVEVRLVGDNGEPVYAGMPGEIEVRGPSVFLEYWKRPDATLEAFRDGWFRTGDIAEAHDGYFRILGRSSVDILKTGGYKVSALEIEEVLRTHPAIEECAVVGVADADLGERVCAAIVLSPGATVDSGHLRAWSAERMAPYKIPREFRAVSDLPRNAMGKVTKPLVKTLFD